MTHFRFGALGAAAAVVGVLLVIFNRQFVNFVPRPFGPAARLKMFQPGPNGRVPILTVIAIGWVIVGTVFVWLAASGAPL